MNPAPIIFTFIPAQSEYYLFRIKYNFRYFFMEEESHKSKGALGAAGVECWGLDKRGGLLPLSSSFSIAPVTSHYTLSDLKPHRFIILQVWRSEVQNALHGAKIKVLARMCSFWRLSGEPVSLPLPASRGCRRCLIPRPLPPSSKPAKVG